MKKPIVLAALLALTAVSNASALSVSAGTQVGGATATDAPSLAFVTNTVVLAANFGGTNLTRDGISFIGVTSSGDPTVTTANGLTMTVSGAGSGLSDATFGDALFGSFTWANNQNDMTVEIDGLNSTKNYHVYYLDGDNRSLDFSMFLGVTASNGVASASSTNMMSWGANSTSGSYYIYLPVTVSGAMSVTARMTKNGSSAGVAFAGVLVVEDSTVSAISVSFGMDRASSLMGAGESAGVVVVTNWNSFSNAVSSAAQLVNSLGSSTGAGISWSCPNTWAMPITESAGNYRMMKSYLDTASATTTTVTVTNIPADMQAAGYDVIVYADGDNGTENRVGRYTINGASIYLLDAGTNFNGTFVQASGASDQGASTSAGNYVRFTGLTNRDLTLTATPGSSTTVDKRAPINGIQIVANIPSIPFTNLAITLITTNVCSGAPQNQASGPSGMAGYSWTVTNGNVAFGSDHSQVLYYNAGDSGNVGLTLTVTNAFGQTATTFTNVPILAPPGGGITPGPMCANSTCYATAAASGTGYVYTWTITGATVVGATNEQTINFNTPASGTVGIGLLVTSPAGCSSGDYTEGTIQPPPTATITTATNVFGNSATNTATGPASMSSYSWTITNGVITSGTNLQTITYTAGQSGNVGLTLTVANNVGCTGTTSTNVAITLTTFTNLVAYDNVENGALTGFSEYNTNNPAFGDRLSLAASGVLQQFRFTLYCSSSQPGYIQTATTIIKFYDNTTDYTGGTLTNALLGTAVLDWDFSGSGGLGSGYYSTGTLDLSALNIVLPTNILVVQQTTNITGTCTRHGVILYGDATVGSSPSNLYFRSAKNSENLYTISGNNQVGYWVSVSSPIAPVVTVDPTNQTVCAGNTASFTATASGTPTPTVQWQVTTNDGTSFANISGATNTVYSFTSSIADSNSQYQAVFVNASGSVTSAVATLTVNPSAFASIIIGPGASCPGSSATASSMVPMTGYSWGISNGVITSGTNSQYVSFNYGASGTTTLYLTVTNSSGCTASGWTTANITPLPDATITVSAPSVTAGSGGNTASGPAGLSTYSWAITNGVITSGGGAQTVTYTAGASGNVGLTLTVQNSGFCSSSSFTNVAVVVVPTNYIVGDTLTNWITSTAGQYVRLYTNGAAKAAGAGVATWTYTSIDGTNVDDKQWLPVYSGVQAIYSSTNWVYIRASGMPAQTLGPLLAYSPANLILPTNQHVLYRFPRNATVPTGKTLTTGGAVGFMVDGATMFDIRDALVWNGSAEVLGTGTNGYWTRDAYVNEGYGFDPVGGHSAPGGAYHYHANPIALRYRLGDHVDFNPVTKLYSESTNAVSKHSPILGWTVDGFPVYGPYGYSNALNPASGVRRMLSGMVLRNGQNGTANLSVVGRTNIPLWAQRIYGVSLATGPSVNGTYPLGRYLEDHDYLGDLTNSATGQKYVKGVNFDLDEFNGRFCVTPEFPNGIYAYFVSIETNGTPLFPYYLGRAFYGAPMGGSVTAINESVVTNFAGVPNIPAAMNAPTVKNTTITLTWSGTEGGTYRVESSTNLTTWVTNSTTATTAFATGSYTNTSADSIRVYRVALTALSNYDTVFFTNAPTLTMSPSSGTRNTSFSVTATISPTATPTPPTQSGAPISSFTVGTNSVSNPAYTYSGGVGSVTGTLTIPANASQGPQTVTIIFSPPPGQQSGPSYTQGNAFTIN